MLDVWPRQSDVVLGNVVAIRWVLSLEGTKVAGLLCMYMGVTSYSDS